MMLSPRMTPDGQRPTLSNFGCFIPRPNQSSFSVAMLSPRFLGSDKPQKPLNPMRKTPLDGRGGAVKERDGFEIFYGVEPKQPRSRRRTATGESTTVPPPGAAQKPSQVARPGNTTTEQKRPHVPSLKLGSSAPAQTEAAKEGTSDVGQRARRLTAPPVSVAAPDPQHPMAAVSSFATAALSAFSFATASLEAVTADGVAAVVDAAMGTTPAVGSTASVTSTPASAVAAAVSVEAASTVARTSPRRSGTEKRTPRGSEAPRAREIWTPRGVPVYSLSRSSNCPKSVESYSLVSPTASPTPSFEPLPTSTAGGEGDCEGTSISAATRPDLPAAGGDSSCGGEAPLDGAARAQAAAAARSAIPTLSLPRPQ